MEVVHARCCGLDGHKKTVVAGALLTQKDGTVVRRRHTFGTMTAEVLALREWLDGLRIDHVALESTGVYWRPVFNLLEAGRTIVLVNAQHRAKVPGRKTDIQDAAWLADLLRHGLVRASFIPPAPLRALRALTRYRKTLGRTRADEVNRRQTTLEGAHLKRAAVATDGLGLSGREMLSALLGGEADPAVRAALARGRRRAKLPALRQALDGRVEPHHRVVLAQLLAHIEFLEDAIADLESAIAGHLTAQEAASPPGGDETTQESPPAAPAPAAPVSKLPVVTAREAVALLQTIPGVGQTAATAIVAEIGTDMTRFPTAKPRASWAGLCPGNKESGGKRLSSRITNGTVWRRARLGECARRAARTRNTYLAAQYYRLARRRGPQKAAVAVAHSILVIAYHVLHDQQPYGDLGADYFDRLDHRATTRRARRYVQHLQRLGYAVTPPAP